MSVLASFPTASGHSFSQFDDGSQVLGGLEGDAGRAEIGLLG